MSPSDRSKPDATDDRDAPDGVDPPTDEERAAAEALRRWLDGEGEDDDAVANATARNDRELALAMRAARDAAHLSAARNQEIIDGALSRGAVHGAQRGGAGATDLVAPRRTEAERVRAPWRTAPRKRYARIAVTASFIAMAAAVAFVVRRSTERASSLSAEVAQRSPSVLAMSRSTLDLFPRGLPLPGTTSDRVERIAYARAADFRHNQFARWGAR